MEFRVQYRAEDVQNKSPRIVFPGFSRFGESHWVTAQDYYGVKIENFPTSFVKQDAIASWRWDLSSRVTMAADYQFESWKRTFRDAARTNENSFHGQLDANTILIIRVSRRLAAAYDREVYCRCNRSLLSRTRASLGQTPVAPQSPIGRDPS